MKFEVWSSQFKDGFRKFIKPITDFIVNLDINPNSLTILSFFLNVLAGISFAAGAIRSGAVWLLLGGLFDVLDGAVARGANRVTKFGAMLDSALDRYAEALVFIGLVYYFLTKSFVETKVLVVLVIFVALTGSLMVSYTRARAEGLGYNCTVGLLQRPERVVTLGVGALVSEHLLVAALIIIACLANFTAIQRIFHIWKSETISTKAER